jgi:hypothetical protein
MYREDSMAKLYKRNYILWIVGRCGCMVVGFTTTCAISLFVCLMVFNAAFNNISVISWQSVLLVEETVGPGENHRPVASHLQTLSHNVVHLVLIEI